jgi:energy-coupling factor transporter ATP-binding protein EcfA2
VIGSNAAGKSNFIAVFRFLRDIATLGIVNAISLQGGSEYIRNTKIGTDRDLAVKVTYLPDIVLPFVEIGKEDSWLTGMNPCESSYEFALRFTGEGDDFVITRDKLVIGFNLESCGRYDGDVAGKIPVDRSEIIVSNSRGEITYDVRIPHGCTLRQEEIVPVFFRNKKLPEKTLLLETIYGYPLPHLEKFFDRIAIYDLDPKLPKKGAAVTGRKDLEENGSNLALVVKNIIEDPEKKRKFSNLLRDILPFVEDFSVQKFMDVALILTLRERYAKGRDLPASSLSDGTITLFGLIIALYFEEKPFIIIEEPVRHIHPFLVARVMGMMKEASRNKQIMITTHSTEVVKHAFLNDILLISRDSEGFSVVSRPSDKEEVRTFLENEIGIEELYVQNLLGM